MRLRPDRALLSAGLSGKDSVPAERGVPTGRARRASRAFTLVELLVVIAIIGVLAAIAVPNLLEAQTRSKVAAAKNSLRVLEVGLEAYCVDNKAYPYTESYRFNLWVPPGGRPHMNTEAMCGGLTSPVAYLSSIPVDPFKRRGMRLSARDIAPLNGPPECDCEANGEEKEVHLFVEALRESPVIEEVTVNYERTGFGFLDDYMSTQVEVVDLIPELRECCDPHAELEGFGWLPTAYAWNVGGRWEKLTAEGRSRYTLFSLGPDAQYSAPDHEGRPLRSRYDIHNRYDPTNGTVSPGNIVRFPGGVMWPR